MEFGKEYFEFCKRDTFDMTCKGDWHRRYSEMIDRMFGLKGKKSLDFGSALGAVTSAFVDHGMDFIGVDVSQWYVENTPFENMKGRLFSYENKLPFESESFDHIHSQQVIEHIPEDKLDSIFKELHRVLKADGEIYISTCPEKEIDQKDPTHISCFSIEKWTDIFKRAGFDEINAQYEHKWVNEPMAQEYKNSWVKFVLKKTKASDNIGNPSTSSKKRNTSK